MARVSGPPEKSEPQEEALDLPQHLPATSKDSLGSVPGGREEGPRAPNDTCLESVRPTNLSSSVRGSEQQAEPNAVVEKMQATDDRGFEEPADQSERQDAEETERDGRQHLVDRNAPASQAEPASQVSGPVASEQLPREADTEAAGASVGSR